MKTKLGNSIKDLIDTGDLIRLTVDGDVKIVELKSGGKSGGCEFDLYFAFIGWDGEYEDDDISADIVTDHDECAEYGISI